MIDYETIKILLYGCTNRRHRRLPVDREQWRHQADVVVLRHSHARLRHQTQRDSAEKKETKIIDIFIKTLSDEFRR